jgi:DNA polymerase-4
MEEAELERLIGPEARALKRRVHGYGGTTLRNGRLPRSVSRETTLSRDERDEKRLEGLLLLLTARMAAQLREEQLMARTVTLKLRHDDFLTVTRRTSLPEPTNLDAELAGAARRLFQAAFRDARQRDRGVRLIGVAATNITPVESLDLFEAPERTRLRQLTAAVDEVREKFGFDAVTPGRLVEFKRKA